MNALVYVDIDQGINKGKMKVALNEKGKKLRGFSFSINIANFEAFLSVFKLTKNPLFLKSVYVYMYGQRRRSRGFQGPLVIMKQKNPEFSKLPS